MAPSSAATATERVNRADLTIGSEQDDMAVSPLDPGIAWRYWPLNGERATQVGD